jgi:hypothetical protein
MPKMDARQHLVNMPAIDAALRVREDLARMRVPAAVL